MRRMNWLYISVIIAALLYLLLLNLDTNGTPDQMRNRHAVVILKEHGELAADFWRVVQEGMQEAARESGLQLSITGPPREHMVDLQIRLVLEQIQLEPDIIILAATDFDRLRDPVAWAHAQNIPIITVDSAVNSRIPASFVATDNVEAGMKAGELMKQLVPEQDTPLLILSQSRESSSAIEREKGVRMALEHYTSLSVAYADGQYQAAFDLATEALIRGEIRAIISLNEVTTLGAGDALAHLGMGETISMVGFDNAPRVLAHLQSGILEGTVVQRPFTMGYQAVKLAEAVLSGQEVDSFVNTGSVVITRENMFEQEYQELLFPFDAPLQELSP